MLKRISITKNSDDLSMFVYRKFLSKVIVECDIGAQKTCRMLQKLLHIVCSREFVALNVG